MTRLLSELRIALRQLRNSPATSGSVAAVLALGIGAALLVSAAVDGLLLRPLPYRRPDRLVSVRGTLDGSVVGGVSLPDFLDLRRDTRTLESLAAYRRRSFLLTSPSDPGTARVVQTAQATGGVPATLGIAPRVGRDFSAAEERDGAAVTLLAWHTAELLFGNPLTAVGRTVAFNDVGHAVVGVLPEGFELWVDGHVVEALVPLDPAVYGASREARSLTVVARLADGVPTSRAGSELDELAARLSKAYPEADADRGFQPVSLHDALRGDNRRPLALLSLAAVLLLASAVVNAGGLLLERSLARARELGVRLCLGAGTADLARRFVAEALVLAALGLTAGWGLAAAGLRLLPRALETLGGSPRILAMESLAPRLGTTTVAVGAALVAVVALLLGGGLTALRRRVDPLALIRFGPGSATATRTRRTLLTGQVAVSVTLLLGASLLSFTFVDLMSVDPGFRIDDVTRFGIGIPEARYPRERDQIEFHRRLEERLTDIPGVDAAGIVADLPLGGAGYGTWYVPSGMELPREERPAVAINVVSPSYFEVLDVPLVRGRRPDWTDGLDAPRVAVVDQTLADEWVGDDPIGTRIRIGWRSALNPPGTEWEVVGIVGAVRQRSPAEPPTPTLYLPASQFPLDGGNYVLRLHAGAAVTATAIDAAVHDVDPALQQVRPGPLSERFANSVGAERTAATLAGGFAALALLLTVVGVYGLVAVDAARRRRELAIRQAVGATRGAVTRLLLRAAMSVVGTGIVLGSLAFAPLSGLLRGALHGSGAGDPMAVVTALGMVLVAGVVAAAPPAVRAARRPLLGSIREN